MSQLVDVALTDYNASRDAFVSAQLTRLASWYNSKIDTKTLEVVEANYDRQTLIVSDGQIYLQLSSDGICVVGLDESGNWVRKSQILDTTADLGAWINRQEEVSGG